MDEQDNDIVVKDKINWKDIILSKINKFSNGVESGYSGLRRLANSLYSSIPEQTKTEMLKEAWAGFDFNTPASDYMVWQSLLQEFMNWAYSINLIITLEDFNQLQGEVDTVVKMIEGWDIDGLKHWAESVIDQDDF